MPYQTITGHTARAYAEAFDAADALTSDETITLDIDCDLDGDQLAVIATAIGHELLAMPASYDADEVTEADLLHDGRIYAIGHHRPVEPINPQPRRDYTICWGHAGKKGEQWETAQEASRYACEIWGRVSGTDAWDAIDNARELGLEAIDDWYEAAGNVIHVTPFD